MTCFSKRAIQLKEPLWYDNGTPMTHINVDCNKCIECLERKKKEWCHRIYHEFLESKTGYFTTLTYDNESAGKYLLNKYYKLSLEPEHLYDFLKRLRHHHSKLCKPVKKKNKQWWEREKKGLNYTLESYMHGLTYNDKLSYIGCGEYGEERSRPHFHLIILNASEKHINESWQFGNTFTTKLTGQNAIGYVLKYMDKSTYTDNETYKYKNKEFLSFSEGIGEAYILKMKQWHKNNLDICYTVSNTGAMIPMAKYYRSKIFTEDERMKQVQYIENKLETERKEQIQILGLTKYNEKIIMTKNRNRLKFNRSLKNRLID